MTRRTLETRQKSEQYDEAIAQIEEARASLLDGDGVLGVGYGPKETGGEVTDEPSIIVYVAQKRDEEELGEAVIPSHYGGVPTDVVQVGTRSDARVNTYDGMWLDAAKIHAANPQREVNLEPRVDYDLDHVAVLEIDDTFVTGNAIDFAKATKRFLASHPDAFDFITFYVDTSSGLPSQGSYHRGIYNKTTGLNYYAGSNLDARAAYGTNKLQAMLSISFFGNYVMLQEFGHMWGAYVRNRDTQNGPRRYDLLISSSGQGIFHWGRFFDNDHSPMDYDGIDWQPLGANRFRSHGIPDERFHFHPLDLYLMGLTSASQVGNCAVIQNPSANSGTITGTLKNVTVQNVVWAEGARNPAYPSTPRRWKVAFAVLTKDARASRSFAQQVVDQRREFTWELHKGTRFLAKVDTTLRASSVDPEIRDIAVSVDDDRVVVGWKTNIPTRGQVNIATSPAAFERDTAHTDPFTTVAESAQATSHGLTVSGLIPDTTYYVEVIAEDRAGLVDRSGVHRVYTRSTNDTCAPDINNVSVARSGFVRNKVFVRWQTDEPSDSVVRYGTTALGSVVRDPYPTRSHTVTLSGLSAGTYRVSVASRDAAGNLTVDDRDGNYYSITIPPSAPSGLAGTDGQELVERLGAIDAAVKHGDVQAAITGTSELVYETARRELEQIAGERNLPEDDLNAGMEALSVLLERLEVRMTETERGVDHVDVSVSPDPLHTMLCVPLPSDTVAQEAAYPVLDPIISAVRPGLSLTPLGERGVGHYRLEREG